MDNRIKKLTGIGARFRLPGTIVAAEPVKVGHINETWRVIYLLPDGGRKSYIFQKINTYVFRNPENVMYNIELVTAHLQKKQMGGRPLHFHHTDSRENYVRDGEDFWRVSDEIPSLVIAENCDAEIMRRVGRAFGEFQSALADLDGSLLTETIPDFHNTRKRLETLFADETADPLGRVAQAGPELAYLHRIADKAALLSEQYVRGDFPVRVTHNDTKCNNVLLDINTLQPLAVIDLDTVMPGLAMYDFGDAVRFGCNTAAEDEFNLAKVGLDLDKFRAVTEGFVGEVGKTWTKAELEALPLAAFSVTVETGCRFLDDYLTGDKYFSIDYPGQNLDRVRSQLKLAQSMEENAAQMQAIVKEVAGL